MGKTLWVLTLKNLKPETQKTAGTKEAVNHCIIVIDLFSVTIVYWGELYRAATVKKEKTRDYIIYENLGSDFIFQFCLYIELRKSE